MKFLMSLHGLKQHWEAPFFARVLDKIDPYYNIDGFEINGNPEDAYEHDYMLSLAKLLKNSPRIIQFHSHFDFHNYYNDLHKLNVFLKYYQQVAVELNKEIILVVHPVDATNTEVAISRTHKLLENLSILKHLHHYNIVFTLENLNKTSQHKRLNTDALRPLIEMHEPIQFCWDIGHEVSENICTYSLNALMISKLGNVHIHDVYMKDHYPFEYGATDYKRAIDYLYECGYVGSIVVELNMALITGNSLLEKFRFYMKNIQLLKNYYSMNYEVKKTKQEQL